VDKLTGTAAGVPYVALPPAGDAGPDTPIVVAYHLLDPPRTEVAFASAVPLTGLDAWRVYFGLPMSGSRLPSGGPEELWRLLLDDAVLNVHRHVTLGALAEFPAAFAAVRDRLGVGDDAPVGVMGGSMGGAAAQLVLADGGVRVQAAVLINPVVQFRQSIDALAATHDTTYTWGSESAAIADRIDFVRRAGDLRGAAIRYITGADDMVDAIIDPVARVVPALREAGATVDWQVVPDMAHALADEPGVDAAPQTPQAAAVDLLAAEWFARHL
jgi:pimeloyl-ACP methyl ester carboxylesterase